MFRSLAHTRVGGALLGAAAAGAVLVPTLAACNAASHDAATAAMSRIHAAAPSSTPAKKNPTPRFVVFVAGENVPDLVAGDVAIERYPGSDGLERDKFLADCDWKGGELVWTSKWSPDGSEEFACEGEDF